MSKTQIILLVVYAAGFLFSYAMLKVEHEAENKSYTKLDRILCITFSFLSFILVIGLLVSAWFKKIATTGYWNRPVKQQSK
jgi:membrane protein insertase Oxa1/YidC/SpoIIIJ